MKKKITLGLILCLLIGIGFGVSGTYSVIESTFKTNKDITTATIGISLNITGSDESIAVPGDVIEKSVAIENTKDYDAYVRVTIYRYWDDSQGNKSMTVKEDPNYLDPEEIKFAIEDGWIISLGDEYGEVSYAYYTKPLKPGETAMILEEYSYLDIEANHNLYADKSAHLEFYADAIQTFAAKDAFLAEWGVEARFDENDNLVAVEL